MSDDDVRPMMPDAAELLELVEKQDSMVNSLQAELEQCKAELRQVVGVYREKDEEVREVEKLLADTRDKLATAVDALDSLKKGNDALREELEATKTRAVDRNDASLNSVVQLRQKVRELEFDLERERRSSAAAQLDVDAEKVHVQELKNELSQVLQTRQNNDTTMYAKLETSMKQAAEWKTKFEVLSSKHEEQSLKLEGRLELAIQRETDLEEYITQLSEENSLTRKEKTILASRITALLEENSSLRTKMIRRRDASGESAGGKQNSVEGQLQKLIADQSHLIAALREETRMLADKLEEETRESRQKIKALKRDKRELEDRLDNFLRV